jgi:hypothetical protein
MTARRGCYDKGASTMNFKSIACALIVGLSSVAASGVQAQSWQMNTQSYALKSNESVDVMDLYWVTNCRSLLTSAPEVTILDGPPGVTASVIEATVLPRFQQCAKPVKGAKLKLSADKIEDQSYSMMTLRIKYKTKDGERDKSMTFSLALFP